VPVTLESSIAASVKAERYYGSAKDLRSFLYYDARHLELGAMVDNTVLAKSGTLAKLLGVAEGAVLQECYLLPPALAGASALVHARGIILSGVDDEDFIRLQRMFPELTVKAASEQASDASLAAASVPIYDLLSV
jgi:hypothetical protein